MKKFRILLGLFLVILGLPAIVSAQTKPTVTLESAALTEDGAVISMYASAPCSAVVYAAQYQDGILSSVLQKAVILTTDAQTVTLEHMDETASVFVLDDCLAPLCETCTVSDLLPNTGDGIIHLNGDTIDATGVEGVTTNGSILTITQAGEYTIEGTLNDGQIIISSAEKSDKITLNLHQVSVTASASDSVALLATKGKVSISATGENTFTATGQGSAAIQTKHDLTLKSSGSLTAISQSGKGIHCKADLEIGMGDIYVTAYDDAIRGNDSIKITKKATAITVQTAVGDGIRTNLDPASEDGTDISGGTVTVNGGTVSVTAPGGDGIQADSLLAIYGGSITVNAANEALKANASSIAYLEDADAAQTPSSGDGCIIIGGGTLNLTAGEHGIKAVKDITISDGDITINAGKEGIKSKEIIYDSDGETALHWIEGSITVTGGTLDLTCGEDGIQCAAGDIILNDGDVTVRAQNDGIQAEYVLYITGGTYTVTTYGGAPSGTASSSVTESCKGLKAGSLIDVTGGTFFLSTYDDALHTNHTVDLSGGTFQIATGDDAVHADSYLNISQNAAITITHCYEGLEAAKVSISGGTMEITATDDGINGAGEEPTDAPYTNPYTVSSSAVSLSAGPGGPGGPGGQGGSSGGPGGPGDTDNASYGYIAISGGSIFISNTEGDGLDANGDMDISGGIIIVDGATLGSEDGLDYDGSLTLSGGLVFTMTAGGMDSISESYTQKYLTYGFSSRQGAFGGGSTISAGNYAICDESGNIVFAFARTKSSIQLVLLSSPQITSQKTYTIRPLNVGSVQPVHAAYGSFDTETGTFSLFEGCSLGSGTQYTMTLQ